MFSFVISHPKMAFCDPIFTTITTSITSRVAQWKRAGPITQRSVDRNHALLKMFLHLLQKTSRCAMLYLACEYAATQHNSNVHNIKIGGEVLPIFFWGGHQKPMIIGII